MKRAKIVTNLAKFEGKKYIRGHTEEYIIKNYSTKQHLLSLVNDIIKSSANYNLGERLISVYVRTLQFEDARFVEEHFKRVPIYAFKNIGQIQVFAEIYGPV
ncbi:MAG: hypothetical protein IJT36_03780 [Alphaproteobacteria bacterium]|nr:hypothetical protein [Alphaproteobacteria bacterium]